MTFTASFVSSDTMTSLLLPTMWDFRIYTWAQKWLTIGPSIVVHSKIIGRIFEANCRHLHCLKIHIRSRFNIWDNSWSSNHSQTSTKKRFVSFGLTKFKKKQIFSDTNAKYHFKKWYNQPKKSTYVVRRLSHGRRFKT